MTDEKDKPRQPDAPDASEKDAGGSEPVEPVESEAMRALLRRALAPDPSADRPPDLLAGVQRRIRRRSKGKFYSDGWSTTQTKVNYVLIAAVMLLLVVVAYFALGPVAITPH